MRDSSPMPRRISFSEYLAWEERQERKHEFVNGEVYAMSGVTRRHDAIATNILVRLKQASREGPCSANSSDVKVRPVQGVIYYPDVSVDCVPHDGADLIIDHPCLVVEVTSRTTARTDRGEKAENYRRAPSLRMYLVVDQNRKRVTCHRRTEFGAWTVVDLESAGTIDVPCPEMRLTLDEIYEGVQMPPLGVAEPEVDELTGEYVVD